MTVESTQISPTRLKIRVSANKDELDSIKTRVLLSLASDVKIAGFREGKAPANLVEKYVDPNLLSNQFLNEAVNELYYKAIRQEKLRVVAQPEVNITKFVPFETLEFTSDTDYVGPVKLPDYSKIKVTKDRVSVTAKDVTIVLNNLASRQAAKKSVTRASKMGDEVNIDFKGVDPKTKKAIPGAEGAKFDLILGSNSFIPGFEDELVGLKSGQDKTFTITFPSDYGAKELQSKKVEFSVKVNEVKELSTPKQDDAFAKTIGPFKTLSELKSDIKKQLTLEKEKESSVKQENDLLNAIAEKTTVAIPDSLIEQEIDRLEEEEKRNLTYRGQTWQEHLNEEGIDAKTHRDRQRPVAESRIKSGLILGEISEKENIEVSDSEVNARVSELKKQYTDPTMQAELDKPENRRDLHSRLMIEKTLDRLKKISS